MGTPTKWHSSPSGLHVLRCGCAYSAEPILGIGEARRLLSILCEDDWNVNMDVDQQLGRSQSGDKHQTMREGVNINHGGNGIWFEVWDFLQVLSARI